ncbi:MAG TPA: DNA ligase D [Amaricoccus sp.]|nr:DNA ligase D [Amaricoccus sp.]
MPKEPLREYRARRDFSRTAEPAGGAKGGGSRFVVHKHQATADHYDLRLELGGVLKSWAVPKGPSLDPADRRLAIRTEDHPVEYIDFEAVIPEGEYGGGPMIVWDTGTWAPMGRDAEAGLKAGELKFRLAGEKLSGGWMLIRLKPKPGEKKAVWLLIKEKDAAAAPGRDILAERPESVKSGRRIEELAPAPPARAGRLRPAALVGAEKGPGPERLAPQLATPAERVPEGAGWLHEIKLDGYRTLAFRDGEAVRLVTRGGLDWTRRYGDLDEAFRALPCREAVIDGEIVVLDAGGVSRFALLQDALSRGARSELVFFAFDLVRLDGWNLAAVALEKRKRLLRGLLAGATGRSAIQFSDHVEGGGADFYEQVSRLGLEGVVSKRAGAAYHAGRSKTWVKVKAKLYGDFVVVGYTASAAAGGLGALALGEWVDGDLVYRGKVGTGFDAGTLADLLARLGPLEDRELAIAGAPKDIRWVRPVLSVKVEYSNLTADGSVRHGVFKGLREVAASGEAAERVRLVSEADLANVWVTNPTRRLFGRAGPTKLDVAVYYAAVGDFMLPHLFGRPVSLVRCPTGKPADCFFQRHRFQGLPAGMESFETQTSGEEDRTYLTVGSAAGYLALAQFGVVEFHTWGCEVADLERADRVVFDLDPGEGVAWREVVEAAVHVRGELAGRGLVGFAKTTGGKGVHVVVPVTPRLDWKAVHRAAGAIAAAIERGAPEVFTTVMGASNRKRRIFIDFHRNARSATAVAPYSLRARNNLPASAPLSWEDLEKVDAPEDLNYASLPGLVAASGDPWADIADFARDLPRA